MYIENYLEEVIEIAHHIVYADVQEVIDILVETRERKGRLFILGVGGSSSTASHAVNDFRKICDIEAYAPFDNVAELTAITNDVGWEFAFRNWLMESKLNPIDTLMVFSVGGGSLEKNISTNLVYGIQHAEKCGCKVIGIVGKDGGYVRKTADASILIPSINTNRITPHTEGFAAVLLHLLVSHPLLKKFETTWESKQEF